MGGGPRLVRRREMSVNTLQMNYGTNPERCDNRRKNIIRARSHVWNQDRGRARVLRARADGVYSWGVGGDKSQDVEPQCP